MVDISNSEAPTLRGPFRAQHFPRTDASKTFCDRSLNPVKGAAPQLASKESEITCQSCAHRLRMKVRDDHYQARSPETVTTLESKLPIVQRLLEQFKTSHPWCNTDFRLSLDRVCIEIQFWVPPTPVSIANSTRKIYSIHRIKVSRKEDISFDEIKLYRPNTIETDAIATLVGQISMTVSLHPLRYNYTQPYLSYRLNPFPKDEVVHRRRRWF